MHPKGERPKTMTGSTCKLCGVACSKQWTEHLCLRGRDDIRANHISILEGRLDNTASGWSVCSNDCNADDNCCQRLAELGQCVLGLVCKCSNDYKAGDHPGYRKPAVLPQCLFGPHHRVIMTITTSPSRSRRYFVRTFGFVTIMLVCPTYAGVEFCMCVAVAWVARVCLINFGMGLSLAARGPTRLL